MADLEEVLTALARSGAHYLVVGGVAVVLHGHPRFTADLDLVIGLERDNARRALLALQSLGYRPRAPVDAMEFAEKERREEWIRDKGLPVFSLSSPRFPATEVDLFVREPFDFAAACSRAFHAQLQDVAVTVASIGDLIALKRASGRPQDLEDIAVLRKIAMATDAGQ